MIKSSKTWWDRLLFRDKGILPTRRLLGIFVSLAILFVALAFLNLSWPAYFMINAVLLLASFLDLRLLPKPRDLSCQRVVAEELDRGQSFNMRITLANRSSFPILYRAVDHLSDAFERPFPLHGTIPAEGTVHIDYSSKPRVRGNYTVDHFYFRYRSLLGLWERQQTFDTKVTFKVIPDMTYVRQVVIDAERTLTREGVKIKKHQIGSGEFASIRSYVYGDDPRKINWRQSAKLADVMTNVYEPEHGKQITLLIDCGRMMGVELIESNRLERAMEAALAVATAALRNGDYVSVLAFSNQIHTYIPGRKGLAHLQTIIQSVYNLQSMPYESNYGTAFEYLEMKQKRRSLILLFSDLDVFFHGDDSLFYIQRVKRRHLFIMLGIADPMLSKWIEIEPTETKYAMLKSMAQKAEIERKKQMAKWDRLGVPMIEAPEETLAITALNRYVEIMNRGIL